MGLLTSLVAHTAPRPYIPWTVGNRYDVTSWFGGTYSTSAVVANTMYAAPIVPVSDAPGGLISLSAIDFRVATNGAAGTKGKVALYAMLASGYPGALIAEAVEKALDPGSNITQNDAAFVATVRDLVPIFAVYWGDGAPTLSAAFSGSIVGHTGATFAATTARAWAVAQTYTAGVSAFPATFPGSAAASAIAPAITVKRGA